MKKITLLMFFFAVSVVFISPSYAAKGRKGASDKAYEHASDEAIFNRVGDWFATIGKTEAEKEEIISERKAKRAEKRAQKEVRKKQKEMKKEQKEMKKEQKRAKKKIKGKTGKLEQD